MQIALSIKNKIHTIRGLQVMLDRDLAELYGVSTSRLNEQIKRNAERFPEHFMFRLTEDEVDFLLSQNAIPFKKVLGGNIPYVFTEQGVSMLASVLRSKTAVHVSIQIIDAFVSMRSFIAKNAVLFARLDSVEQKQLIHEQHFEKVFSALEIHEPKQGIFFDGQVFDAYTFVSDLIRSANSSILLIDNYVDDSVLTLLAKRKNDVLATIFTKIISKQLALDLKKHNEQYEAIEIKEFNKSHDRFLIIDNEHLYHFGASLKDLGKKWFAFSKFDKDSLSILRSLL